MKLIELTGLFKTEEEQAEQDTLGHIQIYNFMRWLKQ